jgi:hypothetical protein
MQWINVRPTINHKNAIPTKTFARDVVGFVERQTKRTSSNGSDATAMSATNAGTPFPQQHTASHLLEVLKKSDYAIVFVVTLPTIHIRPWFA